MKRTMALAALALALVAAAPSTAEAEIQTKGPQEYPGKFELDAHFGFTAGILGGTPGGFKHFGVNTVIGGSGGAGCFYANGYYNCGFFGYGTAIEPGAGIKIKFKIQQVPLVPYIKANAVFMGVVNRYCGDNGFGFGGRVGGGAKYFITKNIGLGIEVSSLFGPAFYTGYRNCGTFFPSHVEFYWSFDVGIGAEFNF
jgi:hypothetical protein